MEEKVGTEDAQAAAPEAPKEPDAHKEPEAPKEGGKGQARSSTSYPYFPVTKVLDIVHAVHKAGGGEAPNADVMAELGISNKTDRAWSYGVPAAIYFGLVERVGRGEEGRLKITDLATRITHPSSDEELRAAKVAAVSSPELYGKLLERLAAKPLPSRDGLKNLLIREFKIVESMAPSAADAFLESIKWAEMITATNVLLPSGASAAATPPPNGAGAARPLPPPPPPDETTFTVPKSFVPHHFPLRKNMTIVVPLPPDLSAKDVQRLQAWLPTLTFDDEVQK